MTSRRELAVAVFALLVPVALVVGRDVFSNRPLLADPTTTLLNWLFMAAPQLVALVIATVSTRSRQRFLSISLLLSAFLVVLFQAWIWFFVPPREGGLAWIFYVPVWIGALAALAGVLAWRSSREAVSAQLPMQRTVSAPADLSR